MNLGLLLQMAAEGMPDRPAVGGLANARSYSELFALARRAAGWIADHPVQDIAQLGVNSETGPVLLFGAAMAGRRFAPLNYRLSDTRLSDLVHRLAPVVVVADDAFVHRIAGEEITVVPRISVESEIATARSLDPDAEPSNEQAVLLFTSGTTGEPRAAVLRHRHLVSYVISTVEFMSADVEEAALISVPPYHVAAIAAILSSVYAGRRIVYLPSFSPEDWVNVVKEEGVTHAMLIPTMLSRITDILEGESVPTLRHLAYGGGRMPLPVIERALDLFPGVDFVNAYGLTETSSTVCLLGPDDHRLAHGADDLRLKRRLASVGRPVPGIELQIRDEKGSPVVDDEAGEIWVRGEQVAGEYIGATGDWVDGWFRTRDRGHVDSDGFVYLEGRTDDVIVRGGENLSPGEIEDVLISHPSIAEAAVVGLPDDEWGQVPAAFVVASVEEPPSEDELKSWVRQRLRSSRVPARITFVDELPYTDSGKLLRRRLREGSSTPD